jgi:hypothetical protein
VDAARLSSRPCIISAWKRPETPPRGWIAARKQALRDAPADPRIDAAANTSQLKKAWPVELT